MRPWLNIVGGLLGLVALGYVFQRIYKYFGYINPGHLGGWGWMLVAMLSLIYGSANILLASAWKHVLCFLNVAIDSRRAVRIYGLSQLAKYVPGNIFQFAGRQALGMAEGLAARPLAKSALLEVALLAVAGSMFALPALTLFWPFMSQPMSLLIFALTASSLAVVMRSRLSGQVAQAWCLQLCFLALSSGAFVILLALVVPNASALPPLPAVAGVYVVAWLVGLVTPGAPAGVGVREAVLLFALSDAVLPADLLLAVMLSRLVTVLGDSMFFLSAFAVTRRRAVP